MSNAWLKTPLSRSSRLSELLGAEVYLKLENLQPSHSFKYRGVSLFCQRAKESHGSSVHLVIASSGNGGLAAACAANALGLKCTVYLPHGSTQSTVDLMKRHHAEVVIVSGITYSEALAVAQIAVNSLENAVMVPTYDHEIVWEAHSSMVEEMTEQLGSKPDAIFCSVGGGGLLGGLITGCKKVGWDHVPIIGLETMGSDCFYWTMALNRGEATPKTLPANVTVMQDEVTGLKLAHFSRFTSRASASLGASHPSATVTKMALDYSGGLTCVRVTDELAIEALLAFSDDHKMLVELACSTAFTAAYNPQLFEMLVPQKADNVRTVVFVVDGGFKTSLASIAELGQILRENEGVRASLEWNVLPH